LGAPANEQSPSDYPFLIVRNDTVQSWLLAVLKFAVTLEAGDRAAVIEIAGNLDQPDAQEGRDTFHFFRRTSARLCSAIADSHDINRYQTLHRYFSQIEDRRLRLALEVAARCSSQLSSSPLPQNKKSRVACIKEKSAALC